MEDGEKSNVDQVQVPTGISSGLRQVNVRKVDKMMERSSTQEGENERNAEK